MNDQSFFDLAMKVIAGHATDAERTNLDSLIANQPKLRSDFDRLKTEARETKDALRLLSAAEDRTAELPAYVRERLQTKVRRTLGDSETNARRNPVWKWAWAFGLAGAAVVIVLLAFPVISGPRAPVIQLAMLDTVGGTRGETDTQSAASFRGVWPTAKLNSFTNADNLRQWEAAGGAGVVKIVYDRAAAEVRVLGTWHGNSLDKTFLVESDLSATVAEAKAYIIAQTRRQ